jgi:DNA-directed RNA polymerase subunit RPC12/RpoP
MSKIHNLGGNQQPPQQPNIKPSDLQDVNCHNCGGDLYLPSFKFKKVSKILVGSDKDQIVPIQVYVCASCGTLMQELLPKELKGE